MLKKIALVFSLIFLFNIYAESLDLEKCEQKEVWAIEALSQLQEMCNREEEAEKNTDLISSSTSYFSINSMRDFCGFIKSEYENLSEEARASVRTVVAFVISIPLLINGRTYYLQNRIANLEKVRAFQLAYVSGARGDTTLELMTLLPKVIAIDELENWRSYFGWLLFFQEKVKL